MSERTFRHQGELLIALTVTMPANGPLDCARARLSMPSARRSAPCWNVRLIEGLCACHRRLVAAQEEERRPLERNIHDGAQQQHVA